MKVKKLLQEWETHSRASQTLVSMSVPLSLDDAARILALAELYPGCSKEQIIADLMAVALAGLEEAMPYRPGNKVIAEDELGDPIYEDTGLTPRFLELTRKYRRQLQAEPKQSAWCQPCDLNLTRGGG